jgi:hypothetical protein
MDFGTDILERDFLIRPGRLVSVLSVATALEMNASDHKITAGAGLCWTNDLGLVVLHTERRRVSPPLAAVGEHGAADRCSGRRR